MSESKPHLLLKHHLKLLRLPVFLREYEKIAAKSSKEKGNFQSFLLELAELELIERERRGTERRIKEAGFPVIKTLDTFDFKAIPSINKRLVMELARCEYISKKENVIIIGNNGTGKTHIGISLGLLAFNSIFKWVF